MPTDAPIQTAITPERVAAEAVAFDAQDRAVVAGQVILDFGATGLLAAMLAPGEWEEMAAYLLALLEREPLKSSPGLNGHRILLGSLAHELRGYARMAGQVTGLEADLRAASSKAEERRIRARIADRDLALDRYLDDIEAQTDAQHTVTPPSQPSDPEEAPIDQAQPSKTDDDAWLL